MPFRPALLPTVCVAVALLILFQLGFWQLRRNTEAQVRVGSFHERLEAPPVGNAALTPGAELAWRRAELTGRWIEHPPFLITGRGEFGEVGYDVVQGLRVDGGPTVLVNRGWIPREGYAETLVSIEPDTEGAAVHGLLLSIEDDPGRPAIPPDAGGPERWPPQSYAAMAARLGETVQLALIVGDALDVDEQKARQPLPVTGYRPEPKSLPHLQYATTWFLIAATLVVIWAAAAVRRGQAR
jgi:surfeit locus 1 family protein